jgi:energy-coupling factor transporter ATP-binding protein EcfA2
MGEKQRVEILKLLLRRNSVLILDEPTTVLTSEEITQLFAAVQKMREQGKAVVFISHKLEEVLRIADDVAILRQGRVVEQKPVREVTSRSELARKMVGREVIFRVDREEVPPGDKVLDIRGLEDEVLQDINLEVRRGEILAVVGVAGNGQKPLVESICGLKKSGRGQIRILAGTRLNSTGPEPGKTALDISRRTGWAWPPVRDWIWWTIFCLPPGTDLKRACSSGVKRPRRKRKIYSSALTCAPPVRKSWPAVFPEATYRNSFSDGSFSASPV